MVGNVREDGEYSGYFWELIYLILPLPRPASHTHTSDSKRVWHLTFLPCQFFFHLSLLFHRTYKYISTDNSTDFFFSIPFVETTPLIILLRGGFWV